MVEYMVMMTIMFKLDSHLDSRLHVLEFLFEFFNSRALRRVN